MMDTIPIVYPHMGQEQAPSWEEGGGYGICRQVPRSFGYSMVLVVHVGPGTIGAVSETHVDDMVWLGGGGTCCPCAYRNISCSCHTGTT